LLILISLIVVIGLITISISKWKVHPFLVLLLAAVVMGFISGMSANGIVDKIAEGFGSTLKSIGIVIALGTIIGTFLELSGGAKTMAESVLKIVGEKKSPFAMNIIGFIVSIPVFCDSGFVILSTLNKALSKKTGISLAVIAVALATGLYATHVFVPPTPGPLAAAATLSADVGLVLIFGLIVAVPSSAAGLFWAIFYTKKFDIDFTEAIENNQGKMKLPSAFSAFTPLLLPIVLIALRSIADYPTQPFGTGSIATFLDFIGNPIMALFIGTGFAFLLKKNNENGSHFEWAATGLKNAGVIILITGAGGAFGNVLRATGIGSAMGNAMSLWHLGILLPFLIAAVLKSAQGSSTVAIITTAALISPLLGPMGFTMPVAKALVVLAIGAGAMTVSHVNDSYFWVVSQFSDMNTPMALRTLTVATFLQGIVGIITVYILAAFLV
jgi:GntP family gluconate:H+ symporter